ncbi:MAG: ADP-dependent glucokinase/phosphofructokinase [Eubacteriales bacterium]|nr:ADP-dependent glucokinase/phosphofructokinase [Eubacteriales bacterium]
MEKAALGFSNTVDYEIQWDSQHLENLIRGVGLCKEDIKDTKDIKNMKDLLASVLFHMREGTGCGLLTERPEVIDEFIRGTAYRVALGGTNLRAAEVISALGGSALVHLVSVNDETHKLLPKNISWVGGDKFKCCFPHIAIQFPKNAYVKANDIEIIAPRENRVIYSGDTACAQMPLSREFFIRARGMRAVLLSGFDLIVNPDILSMRLMEVKEELSCFHKDKPLIFYEHACFSNGKLEDMVRDELRQVIDIYSMNEDEFQTLAGRKIDLLSEKDVMEGLMLAREKLPSATIIVHTCFWVLAIGEQSQDIMKALEYGMLAASTRYWRGTVDKIGIEASGRLLVQKESKVFCKKMMTAFDLPVRCLPAPDIRVDAPTTVGLGDSFVGGFLYKYCFE